MNSSYNHVHANSRDVTNSVIVIACSILQISTASVPIDLTECGDTKGCMVYPMGCLPGDCQVAVTYKTHHDGVDFEAMAPQIGYLTFAISEDKSMVSFCIMYYA